ncbi:MAG: hypothetical protein IPJ81_06200 [Chitinophagaceae bacterium]|jgi:hypothetical protein|nr:hypothetical protein [Chitinophagaceae bacterium]
MGLTFISLKQLEQDTVNGQRVLTAMFKNAYPELGQNIDAYFGNDNFISKEEMANIVEKKQFNERILSNNVNKNILSHTGHKMLTPADRKVGNTVSKFLKEIFISFGFVKVGKKITNGLRVE